ncbi:hypothetical protein scyTo_0019271 [Scyliorhinus torazame]|uniref:Uncharacterized protein n=1 Tax=Scyliorhinus torazame TaxID=75743 RepID=A0A401PW48_SCYTO|nr:hypothetical protein [Scyliorhinus torazame]
MYDLVTIDDLLAKHGQVRCRKHLHLQHEEPKQMQSSEPTVVGVAQKSIKLPRPTREPGKRKGCDYYSLSPFPETQWRLPLTSNLQFIVPAVNTRCVAEEKEGNMFGTGHA